MFTTIQDIIDWARSLTYTSPVQYSDDKAIQDINAVYQEIVDIINSEVGEDYFWDLFTTYTVKDQNEYTIPSEVSKIKTIRVDGNKAIEVANKEIAEKIGATIRPAYYIADNSFFIYPTPDKDNIKIELEGILKPIDLTITTTVEETKLPKNIVKYLGKGLKQYVYQRRGMINEKNDAINEWRNIDINDIVKFLTDRNTDITIAILPDLSYYE